MLEFFPDQVMRLDRRIFGFFPPARKSPDNQTQNKSNSSWHESILIASYIFQEQGEEPWPWQENKTAPERQLTSSPAPAPGRDTSQSQRGEGNESVRAVTVLKWEPELAFAPLPCTSPCQGWRIYQNAYLTQETKYLSLAQTPIF